MKCQSDLVIAGFLRNLAGSPATNLISSPLQSMLTKICLEDHGMLVMNIRLCTNIHFIAKLIILSKSRDHYF